MSLNGLDDPAVQDAYQAAIVEAGGWFFLKYTSRDSVDLLGRGKGGVHEARAVVAKYEEASPLFGVIAYRRRKVLIKLVPEATSRVLLARTAVHFQDVVERYAPYEALLEITSADALTDTSLAASFPLHTATPSASSSRLDEITEDGEDAGPASRGSPALSPPLTGSYFASQRHRVAGRGAEQQRVPSDRSPSQPVDLPANAPRPLSPVVTPGKTSVSQFLVRNNSGKPSITSLGSDSLASMAESTPSDASTRHTASSIGITESSRATTATSILPSESPVPSSSPTAANQRREVPTIRPSTSTARRSVDRPSPSVRPSTASQFNYDEALLELLKPKVKLGPRPVAAAEKVKRPTVASVSALPASYRFSMRKQEPTALAAAATGVEAHPPTQGHDNVNPSTSPPPSTGFPSPPPIPDTADFNPRPSTRGSVKSLPSHKSTAMTPDKLRLMKAVELRKRQLRKSNPHASVFRPPADKKVPAVPQTPELTQVQDDVAVPEKTEEPAIASSVPREIQDDLPIAAHKADSGIEMDYRRPEELEGRRSIEEPVIEEQPVQGTEAANFEPSQEPAVLPGVVEPRAEEETGSSPAEPLVEPAGQHIFESPSSPARASPRLAIPGAFSGPTSPESEWEEPVLDPAVHLGAKDVTDSSLQDTPAEAGGSDRFASNSSILSLANVPTIIMPETARPATPTVQDVTKERTRSVNSNIEGAAHGDGSSSNTDLDAFEMSPKRKNSDLARRRQGFVEPVHVESDPESSDDDFMHELQAATVQEAMPISVSRSPVQEFFPRPRLPSGSGSSGALDTAFTPRENREVYVTSKLTETSGNAFTTPATAISPIESSPPATYQPTTTRSVERSEPATTVPKQRNVSNEISRRIQALAGSSSRESSPTVFAPASRPLSPDVMPGSRSSTRSPTHSRNSSFKAFTRQTSRLNSQSGQPASPQQAMGPVWSVQRDPLTNRESVSVSSRIARPTSSESVDDEPHTTAADPDFQPAQLFLNQKRVGGGMPFGRPSPQLSRIETSPETTTTIPTSSGNPTRRQDPSSTTPLTSTSPTLSRASKDIPRTSSSQTSAQPKSLIPSPMMEDFHSSPPLPPAPMSDTNSIRTRASIVPFQQPQQMNDENALSKETSRTSRFFKRMSNIGGKRKSGMPLTPLESPLERNGSFGSVSIGSPRSMSSKGGVEVQSIMPPPVVIGDLNVQFPDSLLWKRRIISLDPIGNIRFAPPGIPSSSASQPSVGTRHFHLSEFRQPYIPDLDRQELPNSIMLDFPADGTTLQIACEDAMGLVRVGHVLRTYWRAWSGGAANAGGGR